LTWEALRFKLITAVPSTRFKHVYPGIIQELNYVLAVEKAVRAGCVLRRTREEPHFEQIDILANTIHPAIFAELKKCARAVSSSKILRKRSAEFFRTLFAVRRDLLWLRAFQRENAPLGGLRKRDALRLRWQIEWSVAKLVAAGVRFRLGYPLDEEALNRRVEYLNSVLAARLEALAPGWI
jgi:hypothetical protein